MHNEYIYHLFLIFFGASVLATLALWTKQALLVAYIALGALVGPSGFKLISDPSAIQEFSSFGIIFLLFLLGLNLPPQNLVKMLKETTWLTLLSAGSFALAGYLIARLTGFSAQDALIVGLSMMFSSTIIGLKLLPTTVLHNQRTGEIVISILLLQDIIAIFVMLFINAAGTGGAVHWQEAALILLGFPALIATAFLAERFIISPLFRKFNRIHEYLFLLAIGWCMAVAQLADLFGLSHEVGAFIAGITLAANPVSRFIAENLKPLRDFFLILFFFSLGAGIDLYLFREILLPAVILAIVVLTLKPFVLKMCLNRIRDARPRSWEIGFRLGQSSEFSLLVAFMSMEMGMITESAFYLIQGATILTFIASSYFIVMRYPTPIAVDDALRRD